jgi:hypothetical protein
LLWDKVSIMSRHPLFLPRVTCPISGKETLFDLHKLLARFTGKIFVKGSNHSPRARACVPPPVCLRQRSTKLFRRSIQLALVQTQASSAMNAANS